MTSVLVCWKTGYAVTGWVELGKIPSSSAAEYPATVPAVKYLRVYPRPKGKTLPSLLQRFDLSIPSRFVMTVFSTATRISVAT